MPTLANFFRHYLPFRFGGQGVVIADVNRATPINLFSRSGCGTFLPLRCRRGKCCWPRSCPNEVWRCFIPRAAWDNRGLERR
jgi:hypothetical protein